MGNLSERKTCKRKQPPKTIEKTQQTQIKTKNGTISISRHIYKGTDISK